MWRGLQHRGDVTHYELERRIEDGEFTLIASPDANTLALQDTGLVADTTYTYRIRACGLGGCSAWSNEASATTHAITIPPAPVEFVASAVTSSRVEMTWDHPLPLLVTHFEIQRAPASAAVDSAFIDLAELDTDVREYADEAGLEADSSYVYRIRACALVVCSSWVTASVTMPGDIVPAIPGDVTATVVSETEVELRWTAPGGQMKYDLERREGRGGPWPVLHELPGNASSFRETLQRGTYQYRIRACGNGCSGYSEPVTVVMGDG